MQVESPDFSVQNGELTQSCSIQTAYTSRKKKTGSAMQVESPDLRSCSIQTAYTSTRSGMQVESLDLQSRSIQTACTPTNTAAQQPEEDGQRERKKDKVNKVLPEPQQVKDFRQQPETEMRQTSEGSVGEFYDQPNSTTMENLAQHPELELIDSSYREEPLTNPEMRTKREKTLRNNNSDLEHDDVSE